MVRAIATYVLLVRVRFPRNPRLRRQRKRHGMYSSSSSCHIVYNAKTRLRRFVSSYCFATVLISNGEAAVQSKMETPVVGPRFYDGSFEELRFGNSFPDEAKAVSLPYWCPSAIRIWNDRDDARFLRRINVIETYMEDISLSYYFSQICASSHVYYVLQRLSRTSVTSVTDSASRSQPRSMETISQISPPTRPSTSLMISTLFSPGVTHTSDN